MRYTRTHTHTHTTPRHAASHSGAADDGTAMTWPRIYERGTHNVYGVHTMGMGVCVPCIHRVANSRDRYSVSIDRHCIDRDIDRSIDRHRSRGGACGITVPARCRVRARVLDAPTPTTYDVRRRERRRERATRFLTHISTRARARRDARARDTDARDCRILAPHLNRIRAVDARASLLTTTTTTHARARVNARGVELSDFTTDSRGMANARCVCAR